MREGVLRVLDSISAPAYVRNNRMDVLAANRLGRALFTDIHAAEATAFNLARYLFLDARSRGFYTQWEVVARDSVAALRIEAGRNPYDRGLTDLVGELSTRSEEFRTWWAAHNVKFHTTAAKSLRHPAVGELELTGEALTLPGDHGLTIITYTAEPQSAPEQALNFLANWSGQASLVDRDQRRATAPDGQTGHRPGRRAPRTSRSPPRKDAEFMVIRLGAHSEVPLLIFVSWLTRIGVDASAGVAVQAAAGRTRP